MKKLSIVLSLVLASVLFFSTSCGGPTTPGDISIKFLKSMEAGDVDAVIDVMGGTTEGASEDEVAKMNALVLAQQEEIQGKGGIKSVEVVEEKISEDGNKATVKLKVVYGNGDDDTQKYKYLMKDGKRKYTMR